MKGDSRKLPQVVAALAATIGAFGMGNMLGWSSPALPHIADCKDHCDFPINFSMDVGSWIVGFAAIGALVASQVVGQFMMPKLGCKFTMILLAIPFTAGWICLVITEPLQVETPTLFYIGRFLTGFGGGAFALAAPTYVSEIAETSIRGSLGNLMQLMVTIGMFFTNLLAIKNAVNWVVITGLCLMGPILGATFMFFMPTSPYHLIKNRDEEGARKSLMWLRGSDYSYFESELVEIKQKCNELSNPATKVPISKLMTSSVYLKPLFISLGLMFFQQFSGVNFVMFYLQPIFEKAGTTIDSGLGATLVTLAQVLATAGTVLVVEKLGRKIMLTSSLSLVCISMVGLGAYFYFEENKVSKDNPGGYDSETIKNLGWLPLVSMVVYITAFSFGMGPLPWTMNVELYPREAQSFMSSLSTGFNWLGAFLIGKFGTNLEEALGSSGLYFLYCAICALGVIFVIFVVPETKGKTPEDMKEHYLASKGILKCVDNPAYEKGP